VVAKDELQYGQSLSTFVAISADDFEMPVSYVRRLNDFCGVCFNIASISSLFFFVSTRRLFRFLVQNRPSITNFLNKFMDLQNCLLGCTAV
jgi:hypothetical protein